MGQFDEHKQKAIHKWRHLKEERERVPIQNPTRAGLLQETAKIVPDQLLKDLKDSKLSLNQSKLFPW